MTEKNNGAQRYCDNKHDPVWHSDEFCPRCVALEAAANEACAMLPPSEAPKQQGDKDEPENAS